MSEKLHSCQRLLQVAGVALALVAAGHASAQQANEQVGASDNMTIVRDAETGKLRGASAQEMGAMQQQASKGKMMLRQAAPQATQQKFHASGARGARLTDEFMSTSVVVRNTDGTLQKQCFDSHDAAVAGVQAGHIHTTKIETE